MKLFKDDLFTVKDMEFPRCVKPNNAVGDPTLIVFSDGNKYAYGTCAYVWWRMEWNYKACLLVSCLSPDWSCVEQCWVHDLEKKLLMTCHITLNIPNSRLFDSKGTDTERKLWFRNIHSYESGRDTRQNQKWLNGGGYQENQTQRILQLKQQTQKIYKQTAFGKLDQKS